MAKINYFYELESWKEGHKLVLSVYKIINKFPKTEKFGISDQLRRASSSITANISEGFGRYHYADKIKFYHQARGSLLEVQNFLLLAKDLKYLTKSELVSLWQQTIISVKLLNGLIRSTENFKKT